ncbi:MAG: hypothetical protein AB1410_03800 [Acidobacteriota bacterium]
MTKEKIFYFNLYIGVFILIASELLLLLNVPFVKNWFFCLSWWSYILIIDSLNFRKRKTSQLYSSLKDFLFMAFISVFLWLIFEIFNLRLKNWSYHNLPANLPERWTGYFIGFATVIPALMETALFIEGLLKINTSKFSIKVTKNLIIISILIGFLLIFLFLSFPKQFFAFVWLCFIFLIPPFNYILKNDDFFSDLEKGYPGRIISWLIAGLIAGFFWEFWNNWALSRWRYNIPYFNFLKVFEMPILGFLGFPPFALEVFSIYQFIFFIRKKIEKYILLKWILFFILLLFYTFCFSLIDRFTLLE